MPTKQPALSDPVAKLASDYIEQLDTTTVLRNFPETLDADPRPVWFFRTLKVGEQLVVQRVTLLGSQGQDFGEFVHAVLRTLSRKKDSELLPERFTNEVIHDALARFIYNTDKRRDDAKDVFVQEVYSALAGPLTNIVVLVPIRNLIVNQTMVIQEMRLLPSTEVPHLDDIITSLESRTNGVADGLVNRMKRAPSSYVEVRVEARTDGEAELRAEIAATEMFLLLRYCTILHQGHYVRKSKYQSPYIDADNLPTFFLDKPSGKLRGEILPGFGYSQEKLVTFDDGDTSVPMIAAGLLCRQIAMEGKRTLARGVFTAIQWASRAQDEETPSARLIFLFAALEAILPIQNKTEITYQASLLSAMILKRIGRKPKEIYGQVQHAYGLRSKLVHGETVTVPHGVVDGVASLVDDMIKYHLESDGLESLLRKKPDNFWSDLMDQQLEEMTRGGDFS